jgi:para-aminobenzoate synthetase component 1
MAAQTFSVQNFDEIKQQLLAWGNQAGSCCFLDNHQYNSPWQQQECLLAVGALHSIKANAGNALPQLQAFLDEHKGRWVFGHLGYGLKNETEEIYSVKPDFVGFPDMYFFVPEVAVRLVQPTILGNLEEKPGSLLPSDLKLGFSQLTIESESIHPEIIWQQISNFKIENDVGKPSQLISALQPRISKAQYIETIEKLRQHILRGDCYEINFCQEFFTNDAETNPLELYQKLVEVSPNPFSCYYKLGQSHLLCASPERYLMKKSRQIFSQPIKGTAARNLIDKEDDEARRQQLQTSSKDRSENVMVVDLVRNDLAKICKEGSVKVDELFGIYTYPHVHQMISTISGELADDTSFTDIIRATFPMGSMTGAPKKRVMELIDQFEPGSRGIFSGAVGYISPDGDFDFNVVIRSLLYNAETHYLSYLVGGGITWYSQAEKEYEECMLKAKAIREVLEG